MKRSTLVLILTICASLPALTENYGRIIADAQVKTTPDSRLNQKTKNAGNYQYKQIRPLLVSFTGKDGNRGHIIPISPSRSYVTAYDNKGIAKVWLLKKESDGKIKVTPQPLPLRRSCLTAAEYCKQEQYFASHPNDETRTWFPLCPEALGHEGDCGSQGGSTWNPCPYYQGACPVAGSIPLLGEVVCGVAAACPFVR
jgi:hypothetical protein